MLKKLSLFSVCILFSALPSFAYDNDTHFWLTFYLARKTGYSHAQATQIASANISVDFDEDTEPVLPRLSTLDILRFKAIHNVVRSRFHALPLKTELNKVTGEPFHWWDPTREVKEDVIQRMRELVRERKLEFWSKTLKDRRNPGMFIHYLQDSFAHRDFASFIGHAGYSRIDFLSTDPEKSEDMVRESLRYLIAFREVLEGRSTAESMGDPSAIDLGRHTEVPLDEILLTLKAFIAANPSGGSTTNRVSEVWNTLSPSAKMKYNLPARGLWIPLIQASGSNPAPNSRNAREVVRQALVLDDDTVPKIWAYNFDQDGFVAPRTTKAFTYRQQNVPGSPPVFTSRDEQLNFQAFNTPTGTYCPFNLLPLVEGSCR